MLEVYSAPVDTFVTIKNGFYWLFFTIVWDGKTFADFTMLGSLETQAPEIVRYHRSWPGVDTISHSNLAFLPAGQYLNFASNYPTFADKTIGTSCGAFLLDSLLAPLVTFEVASYSKIFSGEFSDVLVDNQNVWNMPSQSFFAVQSGIYFFSINVAVQPYTQFQLNLTSSNSSGNNVACGMQMTSFRDGIDDVSRGCLMNLNRGELVSVQSRTSNKTAAYNDTLLTIEASFRGFLYSPAHGLIVAWSLFNDKLVIGSGDRMTFPTVTINVGGAWNSSTNQVFVPIAGTYFMHIVGQTSSLNGTIDMQLTLNSRTILSRLWLAGPVDIVTRSRSLIADLQIKDVLTVAFKNVSMDGGVNNGISFMGFLLYPK